MRTGRAWRNLGLVALALAATMAPSTAAAHRLTSPQRAAYRQLRYIEAHVAQIVERSASEQRRATSQVRHDCRVLRRAHLGARADAALRVIASVAIRVSPSAGRNQGRRLATALKTLAGAVRRAG